MIKGRIHSIQTLGTLDGPGVRFVVFMQGCNLRCSCCHNPDTWSNEGGTEYTAEDIIKKAIRYREYFGEDGGITVSGGEPLLQAEFVHELFSLCHKNNINTCLDTSGCIFNDSIIRLLSETDRVLLDIKYTDDESYKAHVGCSINNPLLFLDYLNKNNIKVTLRQVIIPSVNDKYDNIRRLKTIAENHVTVDKTELLPFRKICQVKYDNMELNFPFKDIPEPSAKLMEELNNILNS